MGEKNFFVISGHSNAIFKRDTYKKRSLRTFPWRRVLPFSGSQKLFGKNRFWFNTTAFSNDKQRSLTCDRKLRACRQCLENDKPFASFLRFLDNLLPQQIPLVSQSFKEQTARRQCVFEESILQLPVVDFS